MGVHNVGDLSLGQWVAICRAWDRAHGKDKPAAPTEDEFDQAIAADRARADG